MINYGKQHIDKNDKYSVLKTLSDKLITQGPKVNLFENLLKKKFGSKYCSVVSNGTAALHLAGLAFQWKKGDIILCSTLTFVATSNCILYCGAQPDLVDIDKNNYNIDLHKLEQKLKFYKNKKKKVKAVIVTDYAGNPADWTKIKKLSKKYSFNTINDNCHAIGASYLGSQKYAVKYADLVTHSYHPVKNITTGEGGAVLTNKKKLFDKIKILRSHGIVKTKKMIKKRPWYYEMQYLGYNYRITDFQCALGVSQLTKLNKFIKKRNKIADTYKQYFYNKDYIKLPKVNKTNVHAYHLFPIKINFKKINLKKRKLFEKLRLNNINLQVHYIPIHHQPFYKKKFNFKKKNFLEAERFYNEEVSLPIYYELTYIQVKKIAKLIVNICENKK